MRNLALLALLAAPWPAVVQAQALVGGGIVIAPPDPLGAIAARQRAEEERCRNGGPDAIVVCGRLARGGGGYRIPWVPEPGARIRLTAGEAPSATAAMGADRCLRLCEQPIMINILDPRAIARGIDHILSGD
jgi:hypothetical protein